MKFAICNETFVDWPFDKAFATAREEGYTGVEIAPFTIANDVKDISAAQRAEVKSQADQAALEIIGLHWLLAKTEGYYLTSPEADVRQRTAAYIGELAKLSSDLGGRVMVFGSPQQRNILPGVTREQATDYAVEVYSAAMPVLEDLGVVLAVEPLGPGDGNFITTAAEGVEIIKRVDSPNCRLHLDCKAMSTEAQPVADVIRANAEYLEHFHANDPNMLGPGAGELDFVPIFAALADIGYDGWVSVEVFNYEPGAEKICRDSMEYMRKCLA